MQSYDRVLVAANGSNTDALVFAHAALLARVLPAARFSVAYVAAPGSAVSTQRRVQHTAAGPPPAELAALAGEGRLTVDAHVGDPLDLLLREVGALEADLLLVGERAPDAGRRQLARRLAMKAPCSVWMVPDRAPARLERILVPVDLSPRSADALTVAASLAAAAGIGRCQVLHVRFDPATAAFDEYRDEEQGLEMEDMAVFLARVNVRGVRITTILAESADVTSAILRIASAEGSDLIVMGTRGRSSAAAVVLGSETDHVLMNSPVPVLAVKHFGASLRFREALGDPRARWRGSGPKFS